MSQIIVARSRVFVAAEEDEDDLPLSSDEATEVMLAFRAADIVFVEEDAEMGGCYIHLRDHGVRWLEMPMEDMVMRWEKATEAPGWKKNA
jgi:hypothetical protein